MRVFILVLFTMCFFSSNMLVAGEDYYYYTNPFMVDFCEEAPSDSLIVDDQSNLINPFICDDSSDKKSQQKKDPDSLLGDENSDQFEDCNQRIDEEKESGFYPVRDYYASEEMPKDPSLNFSEVSDRCQKLARQGVEAIALSYGRIRVNCDSYFN